MTCPEMTMVVRTYQVCALTMFALSQSFRVVVLEHKLDMSIYGNHFQKLHYVKLQLYKSFTMMLALVSIIYPRITMVDQYSDIREHSQTFNVDYLGTSNMDISWLCSKHSICRMLLVGLTTKFGHTIFIGRMDYGTVRINCLQITTQYAEFFLK